MEALLKNKTAIITGATSGIGREIAIQFAKEGANVVVTGRREENLISLTEEIRPFGGCAYLAGSGEDSHFAETLFHFALDTFGRVDILVCSAGMASRVPTLDTTEDDWNRVMAVNLTFPTMLSLQCVRYFVEHGGGKVVMISSTAAKNINLGASPSYGASKAGMVYLVRHLAAEFGGKGVYAAPAFAVHFQRKRPLAGLRFFPGPVNTEITQTWTPEHRAKVLSTLPLGRMGTPKDIADCALFLASSMSDYINGESILVNGGRYMG